jgi:hypothetical protein
MMAIGLLWLPIVLSAVAVFIASSVIHMFLGWHNNDYAAVPGEEAVMSALRPFGIPPGEYMMPRAPTHADMRTPEFQARLAQGPVMMMSVWPNGMMAMGKTMLQWFVYVLVISAAVGCLTCIAIRPGADPHRVFHVTAFAGTLAYVAALWPASIWFRKPWIVTIKATIDGIIYAVITAGIFVWLWPAATVAT